MALCQGEGNKIEKTERNAEALLFVVDGMFAALLLTNFFPCLPERVDLSSRQGNQGRARGYGRSAQFSD